MQNQNALSGETYMGAINYNKNKNTSSKLTYGTSFSKTTDGISKDGFGYMLQLDNSYSFNETDKITGSIFSISPEFYLAGYSGASTFMSDKTGASVNISKSYKNINLRGSYSKYKSNFANYYDGGLLDFDDYSLSLRTSFKKLPTLDLRLNNKQGGNNIGKISSNSYDITLSKSIKCFDMNGGIRKNSYSNDYSAQGSSSYNSNY